VYLLATGDDGGDGDACGGGAMSKHTPGPWTTDKHATYVFAERHGMMVCEIRGWGYLTGTGGRNLPEPEAEAIQRANQNLIAAAPDLLAALRELRINANRLCDRQLGGTYEEDCRRSLAVADAAIAKAEDR
jgi:hypothetical protein